MMDFKEMGKLLADRRRKLKYTQEMVAEIVGVTDKTIRNIEYGVTAADIETVLKLWDLYNLPNDILFIYYARDKEMTDAIKFFEKKLAIKKLTAHV